MLGSRQTYLPVACEQPHCGYIFGFRFGDRIYIPWMEAPDGRPQWYLHVCPTCWGKMPDDVRWRAVNPPRPRPAQPVRILREVPAPLAEPEPEPEPEPVYDEGGARIRDDGVRSKRWGTSGPRRWHRGRNPESQSA